MHLLKVLFYDFVFKTKDFFLERAEKKLTKKRAIEDDAEMSPTKKAHQMTAPFLADHGEKR